MRKFLGGALVLCALAFGASTAVAAPPPWGPWQQSIPSSGGWTQCGPNVPAAANQAYLRSYQGSRHPYSVATYDSGGNVIAVIGGLVTDIFWMPGGPNFAIRTLRGNNQSGGGNGGYECYFDGP